MPDRVFIDSAHLIAVLNASDSLHAEARSAAGRLTLKRAEFVTTHLVFAELLASMSRGGPNARRRAVDYIDALEQQGITVVRLDAALFHAGLALYRGRLDKRYSLTDCVSMLLCRSMGIRQVLTSDPDFTHDGLEVLLKRPE